ncbi:MAG: DUF5050 domain-containing protein [Lachnospiraceae bacterium]|nr:DUF5050 domain-containing protein [Lachnospiraceae bacterium]
MKKYIMFLITFLVVALCGCGEPDYVPNPDTLLGNSSANLYNGGLFCEYSDNIYFANRLDGNRLYSMSSEMKDFKKLGSDACSYINCDGQAVYYAKINYLSGNNSLGFSTSGISRYGLKDQTSTGLSEEPITKLSLCGNYFFYTFLDINTQEEHIYRSSLDCEEAEEFLPFNVSPCGVSGRDLYYSGIGKDHSLYRTKTAISDPHLVLQANTMMPVFKDGYIYFINMAAKYTLCRVDTNGENFETLVNDRVLTYNFSPNGQAIYFIVDNKGDSRIGRLSINSKNDTTLAYGTFSNLCVTKNFLFFYDLYNDKEFYIRHGSTARAAFEPPIIEEKGKK